MNEFYELSLRLVVAMILGALIGTERELRAKDAGFRTHFLVALGSALFCIVSQFGFPEGLRDSSRVAAQVVSGIGFLGAGTIILQRSKVRGLTTAAGLWVTAAIGLACGTGLYLIATITTLLALLGLELLILLFPHTSSTILALSFKTDSKEQLKSALAQIKSHVVEIITYEVKELDAAVAGSTSGASAGTSANPHAAAAAGTTAAAGASVGASADASATPHAAAAPGSAAGRTAASTLCFRVTLSVKCRKGKDLSEIISILENFSEVAISNKEEL